MFTLVRMATINAFLAVFNLIPLPPLDGGQIALHFLPSDWAVRLAAVRPYGFMIGTALAAAGVVPALLLPFYGIWCVVIHFSLRRIEWSRRRRSCSPGCARPGKLHLGNYFGALKNWVELQDRYRCYYFAADWHALTSDYADPSRIAENTLEMVADWLAAGLDPERSVIFVQSMVPEHAELHLLLSMITPLGWLERVPTYKEQMPQIEDKDLATYGFLGYPVLQTVDIIIYRAHFVPVGEDQASHLEISREIVRRFNHLYGRRSSPSRRRCSRRRRRCRASTGGRCRSPTATPSTSPTRRRWSGRSACRCSPTRSGCGGATPGGPRSATSTSSTS